MKFRMGMVWVMTLIVSIALTYTASKIFPLEAKNSSHFYQTFPASPSNPQAPTSDAGRIPSNPGYIPDNSSQSISRVVEQVAPSVVQIETEASLPEPEFPFDFPFPRFPPPEEKPMRQGLGSGIVYSEDGLILTNAHVVEGAEEINVTLINLNSYPAKVLGLSKAFDCALLKIEGAKNLKPVVFSPTRDLKAGEWVVAIGSPFGLEGTVTVGIISKVDRWLIPLEELRTSLIQTDAAINRGNSGGPLVRLNGEVIGMNTAIIPYGEGLGFAVPSEVLLKCAQQILKNGKVGVGFLGIYMEALSEEKAVKMGLPERMGVWVSRVEKGSPADRAGIKPGDVILEFNGEKVRDVTDMRQRTVLSNPGDEVRLTLYRNKEKFSVKVVLGDLSQQKPLEEEQTQKDWGFSVRDLTDEDVEEFGLEAKKGVIVYKVVKPSPASRARLQKNDIILKIEDKPVRNLADYRKIMEQYGKSNILTLEVFTPAPEGGFLHQIILKR
ncbi:MAG: trypsin-like peptidase domain-containing protein [bacterium JZ-2024 1]